MSSYINKLENKGFIIDESIKSKLNVFVNDKIFNDLIKFYDEILEQYNKVSKGYGDVYLFLSFHDDVDNYILCSVRGTDYHRCLSFFIDGLDKYSTNDIVCYCDFKSIEVPRLSINKLRKENQDLKSENKKLKEQLYGIKFIINQGRINAEQMESAYKDISDAKETLAYYVGKVKAFEEILKLFR